jgi:hypothetical protein
MEGTIMKTPSAVLALGLVLSPVGFAQPPTVACYYDEKKQHVDVLGDITHAETRVELFPEDKRLTGESTLSVVPLRSAANSLTFKTYEMTVRAVTVDGVPATFFTDSGVTVVTPAGKLMFHQACHVRFEFESRPGNFT